MTPRASDVHIPRKAPVAIVIGVALVVVFTALAAVAVPLIYVLGTIYGFTKGTALDAESLNPAVLFVIVAGVVLALLVGIFFLIGKIGKGMEPPTRRERRRAEAAVTERAATQRASSSS